MCNHRAAFGGGWGNSRPTLQERDHTPPSTIDGSHKEPDMKGGTERLESRGKSSGNKLQGWKQLVSCSCELLFLISGFSLLMMQSQTQDHFLLWYPFVLKTSPETPLIPAAHCGVARTSQGMTSCADKVTGDIIDKESESCFRLIFGPQKSLIYLKLWSGVWIHWNWDWQVKFRITSIWIIWLAERYCHSTDMAFSYEN